MAGTQGDTRPTMSPLIAAARPDDTNVSEAKVEQTTEVNPTDDIMVQQAGDADKVRLELDDAVLQSHSPINTNVPNNISDPQGELFSSSSPPTSGARLDALDEHETEFEKAAKVERADTRSVHEASSANELKHKNAEVTNKEHENSNEEGLEITASMHEHSGVNAAVAEIQPSNEQLSILPSLVPAPATPAPKPASSWISDTLKSLKQNKKISTTESDTLVVLDPTDSRKCFLFDSKRLFLTLTSLGEECNRQAATSGCVKAADSVRYVIVLEILDDSMPVLLARSLSYIPIASDTPNTTSAHSKVAKIPTRVPLKLEHAPAASSVVQTAGTLDNQWSKAYASFLRIICGDKRSGISTKDPDTTLSRIECLVAIATTLEALPDIKRALNSLYFVWGGHWESVCKHPMRWLRIAITTTQRTVYGEAFKHLVGSAASIADGQEVSPSADLPEAVRTAIHRGASNLRYKRMRVNQSLLGLTLPADSKAKCKQPVSHFDEDSILYTTVNFFRDWMSDHINALSSGSKAFGLYHDKFCTNTNGCKSVAGFYRVIHGKCDYLDPDRVLKKWNDDCSSRGQDRAENDNDTIRCALTQLKKEAALLCAPMIKSELKLAGKENVQYLTCVEVRAADFPWDVSVGEDGVDKDDDEDEDSED